MRQSLTSVVERNVTWQGSFATEPQECAWASEALFFVRTLSATGLDDVPFLSAGVEISPDGIHWCREGERIELALQADEVTFCRVKHFGGYLRLAGEIPAGGALTIIAYLVLKE